MLLPDACAVCDRGGSPLCEACAARLERAPAGPPPHGLDALVSLVSYSGVGRDLVVALKYRNRRGVLPVLAVAMAQAVVPSMKRKHKGAIINICSVTLSGHWSDMTAYIASKGTLLGLTRVMARELGKDGIRVNAVSPGAIPTALEKQVWAGQLETYEKYLLDHQALKHRGSPEDIAQAILFLVSDKAGFITGQNLTVDGGW